VHARTSRPAREEEAVADYLFLYRGGSMPETEEAQAKVMDAWTSWFGQLGGAIKDGGNPFTPASKTVAGDGSISDTSASPAASGYSIITADSLDAAVDLAKGCPVLEGGATVEVYETFAVM
jgi:hypothetical protein